MAAMEKAYDQSGEDKRYQSWEQSGAMRADNTSEKPPFTIMLPPPNVTGKLHLGHAAMLAIEDILIRFKAMTGHEVLWLPGTDHAAIATENVVLKHLKLKSREELTREDFLAACKNFAEETHDTIVNQTKKMGAWLDWSREAYTLDDERSAAVQRIFRMLYDDGLITRGHRMVNWSVGAQSVLADDEVEWEDRNEPFYSIQCGPFVIGTVRPETKCADSAVVVHPEDERYKHLIGTSFEHETYAGVRQFHVIGDAHVDPEMGTGAMTISTAHDAHDYEIAQRHDLPLITKIGFDGKMTEIAGPCAGLSVAQAREKSVEIMREKGLIVKEDAAYVHRVPLCYRTGTVVEPMLSAQWYVSVEKQFTDRHTGKTTTLKKLTQEAVRGGHVKVIPERFKKIYFQWIDSLRDWCISRQIWWGHRIPIWYDEAGNHYPEPGPGRTQDQDTLDTWFSSALWPFSTLGWPNENSPDLRKFYPGDVLETGHDILFFWVARMIMFGRYATGKWPFHTVYLHGLVCDAKGKKMSKSKGNGIDPIEVIERYGADAVRLSLVVGTTPGNNIPIGDEKIKGYRNFVNKLWNATRFVKMQLEGQDAAPTLTPGTPVDAWILEQLNSTIMTVRGALERYEISLAGNAIYDFVWNQFCNRYIEASKSDASYGFKRGVMEAILRLTHPLCPHVTEACWAALTGEKAILTQAEFPSPSGTLTIDTTPVARAFTVVEELRKARKAHTLNPKEKLRVALPEGVYADIVTAMGRAEVAENVSENAVARMTDAGKIRIEIPFDAAAEKVRIEREIADYEREIAALRGRLSNEKYVANAPEKLVQESRAKLQKAEGAAAALRAELTKMAA